jgi:hypothetical protein
LRPYAIAVRLTPIICVTAVCHPPAAELEPVRVCSGVCSEGSSYSPAARLFVTHRRTDGVLLVTLDSGTLSVPGSAPMRVGGPVLMSRLRIRPFVAVASSPMASTLGASEHEWTAIASGDSLSVTDSLRYGERYALRTFHWPVELTNRQLPTTAWLGFAITGDAIDPRQSDATRRVLRDGVRVFVCDPADLKGRIDTARAARLAHTYSSAC